MPPSVGHVVDIALVPRVDQHGILKCRAVDERPHIVLYPTVNGGKFLRVTAISRLRRTVMSIIGEIGNNHRVVRQRSVLQVCGKLGNGDNARSLGGTIEYVVEIRKGVVVS